MNNATERTKGSNRSNSADGFGFGFTARLKRAITMRQYGESMMTPAVREWLSYAWIIVFSMSFIEAVVWFFVSQYFVAGDMRWMADILGPLFFVGIFLIIWVVDVSFITSERPLGIGGAPDKSTGEPGHSGHGAPRQPGHSQMGEQVRWWFGVLVRLTIVLVSIAITAPFLAQTIRSDEIADKYQALLDEARSGKEAELVELQDDEIARLQGRREELQKEKDRIDAQRGAIIQDAAPAVEAARKQFDDHHREYLAEMDGKGTRVAGLGPRAREAMVARNAAQAHWEQLVREKNEKLQRIEERSSGLIEELDRVDAEKTKKERERVRIRETFKPLDFAAFAEEYDLEIPSDTVGVRVRLLAELRAEDLAGIDPEGKFGPYEKLAFHFKSVEGLSQALLGILFLAMLALKAFEPKAVKFYFNEELQYQWRRYRNGGFDGESGFVPSTARNPYDSFGFAQSYLFLRQKTKRFQDIVLAEMALDGVERERRYQEEFLKFRMESERGRLQIAQKINTEETRRQAKAQIEEERRRNLQALDYALEQEKKDIDNKYRELHRQHEAETADVIERLASNRKTERDTLERERREREERLGMEKEKSALEAQHLKQKTEILKRNKELRERKEAKALEILEEQRKGERARNQREALKARREEIDHRRSGIRREIERYTDRCKEAEKHLADMDARIGRIADRLGRLPQKTRGQIHEIGQQIHKETERQKKAAEHKAEIQARYDKSIKESPDDNLELARYRNLIERHQNKESEIKNSIGQLNARREQLTQGLGEGFGDPVREQEKLTQERSSVLQELDEYRTNIKKAQKELDKLGR